MKAAFFAVLVALAVITPSASAGSNGGATCAVCTLVVGLVEKQMQINSLSAEAAMMRMCSFLPSELVAVGCDVVVGFLKDKVVPMIDAGENPDTVCNGLGLCKVETGVCRLFPKGKHVKSDAEHRERVEMVTKLYASKADAIPAICKYVPQICQPFAHHLPGFDADGDKFSTHDTLRGSYFRGKDCDDKNSSVFPGRQSKDAQVDENCNGIYGTDPATGKTYEEMYCDNTGAMGVAALGDSATAHFRIPPTYLTAATMNDQTFKHVIRLLENEADWPMLSWSTGHMNASEFAPDINGPMTSVYSKLLERNKCNKNDYQNLGVNGARTQALLPFDKLLARNASQHSVKPLLTIMSMVGNDVCNHDHNYNRMTTPKAYFNNIMKAVKEAATFLPMGSKIVLVPLVDGRILYETMHGRVHPIGTPNGDVTYTALYDYLNCLDISPCWGWMNSNASVRNETWVHAKAMNDQIPKIVELTKGMFKNVEVVTVGNVYDDALNAYTGPKWELIEPVDGFHPSQLANSFIGKALFDRLDAAGYIPAANPNNGKLASMFGL